MFRRFWRWLTRADAREARAEHERLLVEQTRGQCRVAMQAMQQAAERHRLRRMEEEAGANPRKVE